MIQEMMLELMIIEELTLPPMLMLNKLIKHKILMELRRIKYVSEGLTILLGRDQLL